MATVARWAAWLGVVAWAAALLSVPGPALAQKYGGVLKTLIFENAPSLSLHEEATNATTWPMLPVYSNLVIYNPQHAVESGDDLVGELAESWVWSDGAKRLTFKLRRGVTWHDGKPFTAADVKHTYDVARGASEKRLKQNPRKAWWAMVAEIVTHGDHEVSFVLKRPQPALSALLASGYAPVIPAHVEPQELRTKPLGTGPFRFKQHLADQKIVLERNPSFFIKGRPYLDGVEIYIIRSRPSRYAALQAGQVDAWMPTEGTPQFRDETLARWPGMVVQEVAESISDNIILNTKRPPFDNVQVRLAVSYAMDRAAMIHSIIPGGAVPGGALLPPPYGQWGLPREELARLPGYGDPAQDKALARKLLAEAGYGPAHPLKVMVSARAYENYTETALWVIGELKAVGVEATLESVESAAWFARLARRDYLIGVNRTGTAAPDPDANFYENYACGSQRNYSDYCNPEVEALMDKASQETDAPKRLELTREIDRRLQVEGARPILSYRVNAYMHWPYVKGLVAQHNAFNFSRFTDVWLDR